MAKDIRIVPAQGQINVTGEANFRGDSNSSVLFVSASGNVGVNTITPSVPLDVSGQFRATALTGNRFGDGTDTSKALSILNSTMLQGDSTAMSLGRNAANNNQAEITFNLAQTGSSENRLSLGLYNSEDTVNIFGNGGVGIGTSTGITTAAGSAKLEVYDTVSRGGGGGSIRVTSTANSQTVLAIKNTNSNKTWEMSVGGSNNTVVPGGFYIYQAGVAARMVIDTGGNVGIGTTSPVGNLFIDSGWDTGYGGDSIYIKNNTGRTSYDPNVVATTDFGVVVSKTSSNTTGPDKPGLVLYNNDNTAGGFTPMLLFAKRETGGTAYKATTAAIYSRSPLGTGNSSAWIDGELIFATAGAASQGIKQRMVIDKEGNVGIGTTSPTEKLTVAGELYFPNISTTDGTNVISFSESTDKSFSFKAYYNGTGASGNKFGIGSNVFGWSSNVMTWQGDGNVGIGTTNPAEKLDISGKQLFSATGASHYGQPGAFDTDSNGDKIIFYNDGTSYDGRIGVGTTSNLWLKSYGETAEEGDIEFYAGGARRAIVKGDGNVGIGTTNPTDRLYIAHSQNDGGMILYGNATNNKLALINPGMTAGKRSMRLITNSGYDGLIIQGGDDNAAFSTNVAMFEHGGNVGIGTLSPAQKLEVIGNIRATGDRSVAAYKDATHYAQLESNASGGVLKGVGGGGFLLRSYGVSNFSGGNVGIYTTAPKSSLHIAGAGNSAGGNLILGTHSDNQTKWSYITSTHYSSSKEPEGFSLIGGFTTATRNAVVIGGNIYESNPSTEIQFWTHTDVSHSLGGTQKMEINSTGRIRFHEYGSGTFTGTPAYNLRVDANGILIEDPIGAGAVDGAGSARYITRWEDVDTITTSSMYEDTNGNIGIGIQSPTAKFDLVGTGTQLGSSGYYYNARIKDDVNSGLLFGGNNTGNGTGFVAGINDLAFLTYGGSWGERMRITGAGNVGIGTVAPAFDLEVVDSGDATLQLRSSGTGNGVLYLRGPNKFFGIYSGTTTSLNFRDETAGVTRMVIDTAGNVGIGTITPASKLNIFTASGRNFNIDQGTSNVTILKNDYHLRLWAGNGYDLQFETGTSSTRRMTIQGGGNVGINTTSPSARLDVYSSGSTTFNVAGSQGQLFSVTDNLVGSLMSVNDISGIPILEVFDNDKVVAGTFGANTLVVTGSSVGIGTDSPTNPLEIRNAFGASDYTPLRLTNSSGVGGAGVEIYLSAAGNAGGVRLRGEAPGSNHQDFGLYVTDGGTLRTVPAIFAEGGSNKVGIGTSDPTANLTVYNSETSAWSLLDIKPNAAGTSAAMVIRPNGAASTTNEEYFVGKRFDGSAGSFHIWRYDGSSHNTSDFSIDTAGDITINNDLSIGGDLTVDGIVTAKEFHTTFVSASIIYQSGSTQFGDTADDLHTFTGTIYSGVAGASSGNKPALVVSASGTTSTQASMAIQQATSEGDTIIFGDYGPYAEWNLFHDNSANQFIIHGGSASTNFGTNTVYNTAGTARTAYRKIVLDQNAGDIYAAGDVGIGTSSPENRLHVYDGASGFTSPYDSRYKIITEDNGEAYNAFFVPSGSFSGIRFLDPRGLRGYIDYYHADDKLVMYAGSQQVFRTSGADRLTINSNGTIRLHNYSAGFLKSDGSGNVSVDTNNYITTQNDTNIYTYIDTVDASTSEDIFRISNEHGAQAFRVTFVCNTSSYSVAKIYEVVHSYSNAPVYFKVVDTGGYGAHDFDVAFTDDVSNTGVKCTITNNSTSINANIATTVFLGGSPTSVTVTQL